MYYIDPHIHMISRVTDDYQRMAQCGCVAVTEPAFWAGFDRGSVDGFRDYFKQLIEFEPKRASWRATSTRSSRSSRRCGRGRSDRSAPSSTPTATRSTRSRQPSSRRSSSRRPTSCTRLATPRAQVGASWRAGMIDFAKALRDRHPDRARRTRRDPRCSAALRAKKSASSYRSFREIRL